MRTLFILAFTLSLQGCQQDSVLQYQLAGTWVVSFKAGNPDAAQKAEEPEKQVAEVEDGPAAGLQKMAEGLASLGEGLKSLGEGLVDAITEKITFTVVLKEDGTMKIEKSKNFEFDLTEKDIRWKVSEGNMVLSTQKDTMAFAIQKTAEGFELQGKEGLIILTKPAGQ